ncbi:MAG TPA: hypothetical protein VIB82_00245 [Caulobacteraceae bacterium]
MPAIIEGPPDREARGRPLARRVLWFVAIALASAGVTALVAYGLEALLPR